MIRIEPYKAGSKAAKALSLATGVLRATRKQVQKHGTFRTLINWGNSERRFENATYINDPAAVALAADKASTAERFAERGIAQPEYTTSQSTAKDWYNAGHCVVARTLTRASGGRGIVLCIPDDVDACTERANTRDNGPLASDGPTDCRRTGVVRAPFYTKYLKKADEYRIHVFDGEVIDVQQKRKRQEVPNEDVDYQIRNLDGGWVYCRTDVECPDSCLSLAIGAVAALGLDFGAADIGYNRHKDSCFVFEVNTAPGLEGSTLDSYRAALLKKIPELQSGAYRRRRAA